MCVRRAVSCFYDSGEGGYFACVRWVRVARRDPGLSLVVVEHRVAIYVLCAFYRGVAELSESRVTISCLYELCMRVCVKCGVPRACERNKKLTDITVRTAPRKPRKKRETAAKLLLYHCACGATQREG